MIKYITNKNMCEFFTKKISINSIGQNNSPLPNCNKKVIKESGNKYLKKNSFEDLDYSDDFFNRNTEDINSIDNNNHLTEIKIEDNNDSILKKTLSSFFDEEEPDSLNSDDIFRFIIKNEAKEKRGTKFIVEMQTFFKIFHPGNKDKYSRKLINSILEKEININLQKRCKKRQDRKYDLDNTRRKIKARFLKALRNALNKRLKLAGSKLLFNYLSHDFTINVTKEENRDVLDKTFKEVYTKDFNKNRGNEGQKSLKKMKDNFLVINYLENNETMSEQSNYNYYKNMKYREIYEEYLRSAEFEENIIKLIEEENEEYIKKYIKLALDLNDFFLSDSN